jgi:heptosyltransferase-2
MTRILILKTAALGDVLRTTAILPGLAARHPQHRVTWVTSPEARDLVAQHPLVERVEVVRLDDPDAVADLAARLARIDWDRVLSFDDELPMCRLASAVARKGLSGAYLEPDGRRAYTDDVEPWFGMGLLARDGREAADRRKRSNQLSHAAIFAQMLGIESGRPELPLDPERIAAARADLGLDRSGPGRLLIGLNTGAGSRWPTKALPVDRVVELVAELHRRLRGAVRFVLFGGPDEVNRNREILAGVDRLAEPVTMIDSGVENPLLDFAAQIAICDLLITSDSLGMHIAVARRVPVVAFFAPTSAAEIELFGGGERVLSTAADYCSYRTDADNSTITAVRIADAVERVLAARTADGPAAGDGAGLRA